MFPFSHGILEFQAMVKAGPLYTGGSNGCVTSTPAPIATEWNEPVLGRDFHPQ
jgi:hypothetical protein